MRFQFSYGMDDALTPLDGRNRNKLASLAPFFSDLALNKYRILVELKYLQKLSEYKIIREFTASEIASINRLIETFDREDYKAIRKIESKTNHDVKAAEEFLKRKFRKTSLRDVAEMIHFGLTSDDINNIAYACMINDSLKKVLLPELANILTLLKEKARLYKKIPMLSRTHGQPAVSTTIGKEFLVYANRLSKAMKPRQTWLTQSSNLTINAKLTGNVGNLNAHKFIFPQINWLKFSKEFIVSFGLAPDLVTTQIEPYDSYIHIFNQLLLINNLLLGLCHDMWLYIMLGYFKQKVIRKEVGSTALPHKVNPIHFEGAEGGFGIANALFEFYIRKLSYSRLQRDLSDSTVRRSFGIAFGYSLLSYQSVIEGLKRIEPNQNLINKDLDNHWEVLSEAIQNFLRVKGYSDAYGKTKDFFRGKNLSRKDIVSYIQSLDLSQKDKSILLRLTPNTYTGYAEELVDNFTI